MQFYKDETIIENPDYPVFYGYKYLFEFKDGTSEIVISPFLKEGCTITDLKNDFYENECKLHGSAENIPWQLAHIRKCGFQRDTDKDQLPTKFYW